VIIPVKAVVENFLSFRDKQEFEYQTQGVHYIYGINYDSQQSKLLDDTVENNVGVGKSTLAFVMQYAFYGKVQKKINKDKIINKYAGRNLFVQLDFYVDQQLYRIQRYRKHFYHRNQVFLYRFVKEEFQNISDIDPSSTEEKIQKLIIIDNETFQKSGLITREDKSQFLELPTLNRGYIFENLSQLQKLKEYLEKTRRKKLKIESELTTLNTKIIELSTITR
jgi:DNA repair exonuclease SbcCD ATPase subunit